LRTEAEESLDTLLNQDPHLTINKKNEIPK